MPKVAYIVRDFKPDSLAMIERANAIIGEYQAQGFTLTLRQLYYQFVARGLLPNRQTEYKRLGSIINDGRLAGLIDWTAIEDRTRNLQEIQTWSDPADIINAVARGYRRDLWSGQPWAPEVWIEKDALVGVIEGVCDELRVPYFACRGYSSQSEQWRAGRRFRGRRREGAEPIVFHLGDHDPSGIDMTRDNRDRLTLFAEAGVEVRRLALNMDQVEQYGPPPNPAKLTDSRAEGYIAEHGTESWELDALDPPVIAALIRDAVTGLIDQDRWTAALEEEVAEREALEAVSRRWTDVERFVAEQEEGDDED